MLHFTHATRNQDDRTGVSLHRKAVLSSLSFARCAGALLALGLSFLLPSTAFAAIAFVNSNSSFNLVAASTASTTVTGCTNTNPLFVVGIWSTSGAAEPTSIIDNGVAIKEAMTHVFTQNGTYRGSIWYGTGATTTTHYFLASFADGTHFNDIFAGCYTGAAQSGQPDATSSANYNGSAAGTSLSLTVNTATDNDWVAQVSQANTQAPAGGTNNTNRQVDNNQGVSFGDSNAALTPAGNQTVNFTTSASAKIDAISIPFKPSVAVVSTPFGIITWFGWF